MNKVRFIFDSPSYYEAAYEKFVECKQNKAITSENCLLVFFNGMAKKFKPGEINVNRPKFGALSSFPNINIFTPPLANQLFPSARQLWKTKLRNRPAGMKSTEIIGDVKKSIVYDSGEIISTVREEFSTFPSP